MPEIMAQYLKTESTDSIAPKIMDPILRIWDIGPLFGHFGGPGIFKASDTIALFPLWGHNFNNNS